VGHPVFVAVGFWNTVGAGLLGFAINPPASLYYVQGLNMTAAHGHAALFGVYGMLGIGLMLFCLRGLYERSLHADRFLKPAFWSLNIGLAMMVFLSLLPAGIYQAWASVSRGLWFARSPEIVHSPLMEALVWLRVPGDMVFAAGSVLLAVYALRLLERPRRSAHRPLRWRPRRAAEPASAASSAHHGRRPRSLSLRRAARRSKPRSRARCARSWTPRSP
jgi:nitric oxide reductase subunit B